MDVRDEIAVELGYKRVAGSDTIIFPHWIDRDGSVVLIYDGGSHDGEPADHVIDNTLDACASLWAEHADGWEWGRCTSFTVREAAEAAGYTREQVFEAEAVIRSDTEKKGASHDPAK